MNEYGIIDNSNWDLKGAKGKSHDDIYLVMKTIIENQIGIGHDFTKEKFFKLVNLFINQYVHNNNIECMAGVYDFIELLKKHNIPAVVVTNTDTEKAKKMLSKVVVNDNMVNLLPYFDQIMGKDCFSCTKPDPAPYLTAVSYFQQRYCTSKKTPFRILVVEDSKPGILSGVNAKEKLKGTNINLKLALVSKDRAFLTDKDLIKDVRLFSSMTAVMNTYMPELDLGKYSFSPLLRVTGTF